MSAENVSAFSGIAVLLLATIKQNAKSNKLLGSISERIISHNERLLRIEQWIDRRPSSENK